MARKKFTTTLDAKIIQLLKTQAIHENTDASKIIEELVINYLKEKGIDTDVTTKEVAMSRERYEFIRDHLHELELDLENGKILNRNANSRTHGYPEVRLSGARAYQHQVFAVARWGEKCIGMTVNHINEIKHDNSWDNLELLTSVDNIKAATKRGGDGGASRKQPIKAICLETGEEWVFGSYTDAAKQLGVRGSHISEVAAGKRRQTGGYKFERVTI